MRRLITSSGAMLASLTSRAAAQWMLVWLFAYYGGAAHVGAYAHALALTSPIFMLSEGGLRSIIVTAQVKPSYRQALLIRSATAFGAAFLCLIVGSILGIDLLQVLLPLCLLKALDSLLDIALGFLQAAKQFKLCAAGGLLNSLSTIAFGLVAVLTTSVAGLLWASCLGSAIAAGLLLIKAKFSAPPIGGMPRVGQMSLLGVSTGVNSLVVYAPVLYLGTVATSATAGIYAAVVQGVAIANIVLSGAHQGLLPWLASKAGNAESAQIWRQSRALFVTVGGTLAIGLVLFTPPLAPIIYGAEFKVSYLDVLPLGACCIAMASIQYTSAALLVANKYGVQLYIGIFAICSIAFGWLFLAPDDRLIAGTLLALIGYCGRALAGQFVWRRVNSRRSIALLSRRIPS